MSDLPPGFLAVLVFGLILALLSLPLIEIRRKQIRQMADTCSELARKTGLNYIAPVMSLPGILFSFRWTFRNAAAQGLYRSRGTSLSMTGSGGGWSGEYAENPPVQYCVVELEVRNSTGFKLTISPRWILSRLFDRSDAITGDKRFDQRLIIQGKPLDFLEQVSGFIRLTNPSLLAWMIEEQPRISLRGPKLSCKQGLMKNLDDQIAVLNFLCDLADFTERNGSNSAVGMMTW